MPVAQEDLWRPQRTRWGWSWTQGHICSAEGSSKMMGVNTNTKHPFKKNRYVLFIIYPLRKKVWSCFACTSCKPCECLTICIVVVVVWIELQTDMNPSFYSQSGSTKSSLTRSPKLPQSLKNGAWKNTIPFEMESLQRLRSFRESKSGFN